MSIDSLLPLSTESSKQLLDLPLINVIDSYIKYYASGNSHTARAKRNDLNVFLDFLVHLKSVSKIEKLKVKDWDFSSVQRFVEQGLSKGEAPATVNRRLATIKHMGRTLSERVPQFVNPAREVKAPRVNQLKPKAISSAALKNARVKADERISERDTFTRKRNKTIFNLLLDTGLRADEVRLIRLSQLDDNLEWIQSVRTKGRKFRNVYITSAMRPELAAYLQEREEVLKKFYSKIPRSENRALPLFISTYRATPGKTDSFLMGPKTLWRAIHELSGDAHLHPHLLRHSFALDLLEDSNDIRLVSQALGHSDVRITMRYTERRDEEIAQALEKSRRKKE